MSAAVSAVHGAASRPSSRRRRETRRRPASVGHGPCRGTAYPRYAADKALLPRLLGTYECEVHGAVEKLCSMQPDVVAIAGAGEGYYVGGVARRVPSAASQVAGTPWRT